LVVMPEGYHPTWQSKTFVSGIWAVQGPDGTRRGNARRTNEMMCHDECSKGEVDEKLHSIPSLLCNSYTRVGAVSTRPFIRQAKRTPAVPR
jgi:hypothetical protein